MQPILLHAGPITLYSYGVFIALAFLVGGFVSYRLAKRAGLQTSLFIDYFLYAALAGLFGARVWHLLFRPFEVQTFWQAFSLWGGGLSLQGGVALAIVVLILVMRRQRQPVWQWLDVMTIGALVGLTIGKFGSWLNGDFFGRSSKLPWAMQFHDPLAPAYIMGVKLHPLQLYAVAAFAIVATVCYFVYRRQRHRKTYQPGGTFLLGLFLLSASQLLLEFWHAPIDSMYVAGSIRIVSVTAALIMLGTGYLLIRQRRRRPSGQRRG